MKHTFGKLFCLLCIAYYLMAIFLHVYLHSWGWVILETVFFFAFVQDYKKRTWRFYSVVLVLDGEPVQTVRCFTNRGANKVRARAVEAIKTQPHNYQLINKESTK